MSEEQEPPYQAWSWRPRIQQLKSTGQLTAKIWEETQSQIFEFGDQNELDLFHQLYPQPSATKETTVDPPIKIPKKQLVSPPSLSIKTTTGKPSNTGNSKQKKPHFGAKAKKKRANSTAVPPAKIARTREWVERDRTWSPPKGVTHSFFQKNYSNQWSRPPKFTKFIQQQNWGSENCKLGFTGYKWCPDHDVIPESEWDLLIRKIVMPLALINIPFQKPICEKLLTKLVRLCFTNRTSMCVISPYRPKDPIHTAIYNSVRNGYVLLKNPVSFLRIQDNYSRPGVCSTQIIILFINFPGSPKISVENNLDGIWNTKGFPFHKFNPVENLALVQAHKSDFSTQGSKLQSIVDKCTQVEQIRLQSRDINISWPELKLNNFRTQKYGFNVFAPQWHSKHPDPLWQKHFPGMTKPAKRKTISYQEYNILCGDDSKLFQDNKNYENHLCTLCGKTGHPQKLCWRRVRSSNSLKLTDPTEKALHAFLLSFPTCRPFKSLAQNQCPIAFINELQKDISHRANHFNTSWHQFALSKGVNPSLVQPGFGQLRQGLPYWYALGCPTFILQWIAFGIPVFWTDMKPQVFEVKHDEHHGKPKNSHPEILSQMEKFHELGCLLPIRRKYVRGCAPLFTRFSSNKVRCIHDLRYVNRFILSLKFTLTTAINFCALCAAGTVFITTDFSKAWHQLRHLLCDSLFFCMKIIKNHTAQYFRPNGKTFGESDVPFAITVLVKYVTDVFNLFTICSFWIDDGIIAASNTNRPNWRTEASRTRSFTAWIFGKLCFKLNTKCDLSPQIEKDWVGCWNSAEFVYTKATKIQKVAQVLQNIITASKITYGQAQSLCGKVSTFCQQNTSDPSLKILLSVLTTVVRLFNEDPTKHQKSDSFNISPQFLTWCDLFLTKLQKHLRIKSHPKEPTPTTRVIITCDASNIGGGLAIYKEDQLIFETALSLPPTHILSSGRAELEPSSTDNERLILLKLALETAKAALHQKLPHQQFFADIRTDSLPLVFQSMGTSLKTPAIIYDIQNVFEFLENWKVPYSINHHKREHLLAKIADQNSRIYFPQFTPESKRTLHNLCGKRTLLQLDVTNLLLKPSQYISDIRFKTIFIPLNLSNTLYAKIFSHLTKFHKSNKLLVPKIKQLVATLHHHFTAKFTFSPSSFFNPHPTLLNQKFLHYILFEDKGGVNAETTTASTLHKASRKYKAIIASSTYKAELKEKMQSDSVGQDTRTLDFLDTSKVTPHTLKYG